MNFKNQIYDAIKYTLKDWKTIILLGIILCTLPVIIETETNEVEEFLTKTYNKWLEEINQKFNALIESIRYKNKLYNFIINFYESKEFNYQNIYNIKIVSQNQQKRNSGNKLFLSLSLKIFFGIFNIISFSLSKKLSFI